MASPLDEVGEYDPETYLRAASLDAPPPPPPLTREDVSAGLDNQEQQLLARLPNTNRYGHRQIADQIAGVRFQRRQLNDDQRQEQTQNRLKAKDLADRGIPTFRNASGGVSPVTDEGGSPLTHYDKAHDIAYDSAGNPKVVSFDTTAGPPALKDPFANIPVQTDQKTGEQYQKRPGLAWNWVGTDEGVKSQRMQEGKDKAVAKEAALIGQKLSIDHADLVAGEKEHNVMTKELQAAVPTLQDPKYAGANRDAVLSGIDEHFNSEYARPEANATNGWFSKDLSPSAQKLRADIDSRKANAIDKANGLFDLKERQIELGDQVSGERDQRKAEIETLIAHGRGQAGPLDQPQPHGAAAPAAQITTPNGIPYPVTREGNIDTNVPGGSVQDALQKLSPGPGWNYNGSTGEWSPPTITPDDVHAAAQGGHIPMQVAPAALAAAHDAQDANAKADALQESNPGLAGQFKAVAQGILHGLATGIADIVKGAPGVEKLVNPLSRITGPQSEGPAKAIGEAIQSKAEEGYDKALSHTIGGKIGNFVGGALPFVGASILPGGAAVTVPTTVGTLFSAGYGATKEAALNGGASPEKAELLANASGVVNGVLGLPFKGIGGALRRVFGGDSPKIIKAAVESAFQREGAAGAGKLIDQLRGYVERNEKPVIAGVAQDVREQVVAAIDSIKAEMFKTPAQRAATVVGHMLKAGAIGGGVAVGQNIIAQQYDPSRGTFEGVPENALGFAALAGVSHGWDQVVRARRAKQALDLLRPGEEGPPALRGQGPTPPPPSGSAPAEPKQAKAKTVEPTEGAPYEQGTIPQTPPPVEPARPTGAPSEPVNADAGGAAASTGQTITRRGEPAVTDNVATEETAKPSAVPGALRSVADKLVALRDATPDSPEARVKANEEAVHVAGRALVPNWDALAPKPREKDSRPALLRKALDAAGWSGSIQDLLAAHTGTVDQAAHEAATSPTNTLPEPTHGQQQAGNYQKGHIVQLGGAGGINVAIENPAGSQRSNLDTATLQNIAETPAAKGGPAGGILNVALESARSGDYVKARQSLENAADDLRLRQFDKLADSVQKVSDTSYATPLESHYGYIKGTVGADKDHVDVFVKPGTPTNYSGPVYVVDQTTTAGKETFDEHKAIIGAGSHEEALAEYRKNYDAEHQNNYGGVTEFKNIGEFKQWLDSGSKGPAAKSKGVALHPTDEHQRGVEKRVIDRMVARQDVLEALAHPTTPRVGRTSNPSGIETIITDGTGQITIDPAKLARATRGMPERQQSKFIDRAIDEEILHVAQQEWVNRDPRHEGLVSAWGAEKDELDAHMASAYDGWERLNDRQKGFEKQRAVLQKRWTGKLSEAAYQALQAFIRFLRTIWDKLSDDQRKSVEDVESIMKGHEPAAKAEREPTTKIEKDVVEKGIPLSQWDDMATLNAKDSIEKYGTTRAQIIESIVTAPTRVNPKPEQDIRKTPPATEFDRRRARRQQLEQRVKDLGESVPATLQTVLRTLLKSGPKKEPSTLQLDQAERKLNQIGGEDAITTGEKPKGSQPEHSGVPSGENVPAHGGEIRKSDSEQTGGRGEPDKRPTSPEPRPKAETPAPKPAVSDSGVSTLTPEEQAASDELFGGLGAAKPIVQTKSPKMIAIYQAVKKGDKTVEQIAKDYAMQPHHVEKIYDSVAGTSLGAAAPPRITHAALKLKNGKIVNAPDEENNHAGLYKKMGGVNDIRVLGATMGFTTSDGRFLTRDQAYAMAGFRHTNDKFRDQTILGAALPVVQKPLVQKGFPDEKADALFKFARLMVKNGVDTPVKLAAKIPENGRPYAQALWSTMAAFNPKINVGVFKGEPDWKAYFSPEQPKSATVADFTPAANLAGRVVDALEKKTAPGVLAFSNEELFKMAAITHGGTLAEGKLTPKDAYDAMELGVNQYIDAHAASGDWNPAKGDPDAAVRNLKELIARLPTQRHRTEEQGEFQQFSTPPPLAFAVAWAANLKPDDVVLEPSAGIGGIAVFAKLVGAKVVANELSDRRLALLKELGVDRVTNENAEHLNAVLPKDIVPSVVLMNPPFSATAGRMEGKRATAVGAQHVVSALERLPNGGRLVAIVGEGMAHGLPKFDDWWARIEKEYNVRADVGVEGKEYYKYGTSFGNRLLVIDKTGPTPHPPITGKVERVEDLFDKLAEIRNDRPSVEGKSPSIGAAGEGESSGVESPESSGGSTRPKPATSTATGDVGTGSKPRAGSAGGSAGTPTSPGHTVGGPRSSEDTGAVPGSSGGTGEQGERPAGRSELPVGNAPIETARVEQLTHAEPEVLDTDEVFAEYSPQKIKVANSKPHPTPLVESASMRSVSPPDPVYQPKIPPRMLETGALSVPQFEATLYAGQAHTETLESKERKGFFIGDGTGVGKGREIASIIVDNRNRGRKRAVWISEKKGLIKAAAGDFSDLGEPEIEIANLSKTQAKTGQVQLKDGVLFSTYATFIGDYKASRVPREWAVGATVEVSSRYSDDPTGQHVITKSVMSRRSRQATIIVDGQERTYPVERLKSVKPASDKNKSRLDQMVEWLGKDFDGVIIFDEAHNAQNAITIQGKRGTKEPSQTGLAVVELQARVPNARIIYASATGATEVYNLAYADRLGIWGPGTAFAGKQSFFAEIGAAGLSAMEIVARDLKAMGSYISRTLSFKGVDLEIIEHELSQEQIGIYNNTAVQWQRVYSAMNQSMVDTNASLNANARKNVRGRFFSAQQRFYNQLLTAMQTPSLIKAMRADLDKGEAVLVQLTNTNEAILDRALMAAEDEERPLEELDLSPKDILQQHVADYFPVQLYEPYTDENGNVRSSIVMDSQGKPVLDPKAIEERDRLLDEIGKLPVPDNPLEQIINTFGYKNIAEVTGRSTRVVKKDVDGKQKAVKEHRSDSVRLVEAQEFNDDKRQILLFSDAGGTGFSYHSDRRFKNQRRRNHYVAQAGWRADKAIQGIGRSNRSNQATAPFVKLVRTNIEGHKRFISTVARRLAQLGALTTGERRTNTRGLFTEDDNLEDDYAATALRSLVKASLAGSEPALPWDTFTDKMGFDNLLDSAGQLIEKKMPDVPQFLNRVLMLEFDDQNRAFNAFFDRRQRLIDNAKQQGVYDPGLQTLHTPKDGVNKIVRDEEVYRDPKIETPTRLVELEQIFPAVFTTFAEAERSAKSQKNVEWVRNTRSGAAYLTFDGTATHTDTETGAAYLPKVRVGIRSWTLNDPKKISTVASAKPVKVGDTIKGATHDLEVTQLPTASYSSRLMVKETGRTTPAQEQTLADAMGASWGSQHTDLFELAKRGYFVEGVNDDADYLPKGGTYEKITKSAAAELWNKQIADADPMEHKTMHFVVGLMLPIWNRLQIPRVQVFRVTVTDGESFLGVKIPEKSVIGVRARLGAGATNLSPKDVFHQVLDEGEEFSLSNDWKIVRRKLSGDYRIEVTGPTWDDRKNFEDYVGGFVEKVGGFQTRYFIPTDEATGVEAIKKLTEKNPVVEQAGTALGAAAPKFARDLYEEDVGPALKAMGMGFKEAFDAVRYGLVPTSGVAPPTVDAMMKFLGERNQTNYVIRQTLRAAKAAFDKMPQAAQIEFIDRFKRGEEQPTQFLTQIASTLAQIDTEAWNALANAYRVMGKDEDELPIKWKENHFRVLWRTVPGDESPNTKTNAGASGKRPLRGSRGMLKRSTLADMSEGLERGGVPYSYNPVVMFELAQADIWKLTTALKMWQWGKDNGLVTFMRGKFAKPPPGTSWLDDNISRVYFGTESGVVEPGRYAVETGFARLINNYLSKDVIRQMKLGRGLIWMKNFTTSLELALSLFHGVFETGEVVASNIGLGLSKLYNRGALNKDSSAFLEGLLDIVKSPSTPVTQGTLGAQVRKAAGNPDEFFKTPQGKKLLAVYPNAKELIGYLFAGGWKPNEVEADWKNKSIRAFTDAVSDLKAGKTNNHIGAGLRAFPAANEFLMHPLFDVYIPNLKVAQFFREMTEAIKQADLKYPGGYYIDRQGKRWERPTNETLARKVWRLVEDRFGELNYDTLFWNNTFKSAMQLMFRSVTWKLGSVEAFGGAFAGQGKEFMNAFKERRAPELHRNMAWLFGIFLLTAAVGAVIQKVFAGKDPSGPTDLVFPQIDPRDDKVRVSIPTYFKDLVHLVHSPTGYVKASLAGWIGRVADLLSNKDYYGVQIRNDDDPATKQALQMGKYAAQSILPFSIRGYKNLSQSQENTVRKSMALFGVNPAPRYIGQTAAEQQVEKYWKGQRTEEGTKPEQYEIQKGKREIVSKIRHGSSPDISGALARGTIKPADIPALYKRATMGQLASSIDKMPLAEAEKVFARANPTERAQLAAIIARKRANSLRRSGRTMYAGF